jgi:hypothetical protein
MRELLGAKFSYPDNQQIIGDLLSESGLSLNNPPIQTKFPYIYKQQTALIESAVGTCQ